MARFYVVRLKDHRAKAVFWISEAAAGCAFAIIILAILFGLYLLGLLPDVDAAMRGRGDDVFN